MTNEHKKYVKIIFGLKEETDSQNNEESRDR